MKQTDFVFRIYALVSWNYNIIHKSQLMLFLLYTNHSWCYFSDTIILYTLVLLNLHGTVLLPL